MDDPKLPIPMEILLLIADYIPITFACVDKWFNEYYKLGIVADYNKCIKLEFSSCHDCDMVFNAFSIDIDNSYSQIEPKMQRSVDIACRLIRAFNIDMPDMINHTVKPDCMHRARRNIYGFSSVMSSMIIARRCADDYGLLRYMRTQIPYASYRYAQLMYNNIDTRRRRMQGFIYDDGKYWQTVRS